MVVFLGCGKTNPAEHIVIRGYLQKLHEIGVKSLVVIQEPKAELPEVSGAIRAGDFLFLLDTSQDFQNVNSFKELTLEKIQMAVAKKIEDLLRKYKKLFPCIIY